MLKRSIATVLVACMLFAGVAALAPTSSGWVPVYGNAADLMYASAYDAGPEVTVSLPAANVARLNPANALGTFDAAQSSDPAFNSKFYATASHQWTNYTFAANFWNVDGESDIEFCEVTWSAWHVEAVAVYLIDAYIWDGTAIVPYVPATGEGVGVNDGYYAGIAWNKQGITALTEAQRNNFAVGLLPAGVTRTFEANNFHIEAPNFGWTEFYLPGDVVYASGVMLDDVTAAVYNLDGNAGTYTGNTDGYDLDAIRVYGYTPSGRTDSATGCGSTYGTGTRILDKGTWFMYNEYAGGTKTFPIQAGNPKDGANIVGTYTITANGDGTFTATYDMGTVVLNGHTYNAVVTEEHLSISDGKFTYASPGKLDNQDFGVAFSDADGNFYVFAHFVVEYW